MNTVIQEMFDCLANNGGVYLPSRFWQELNTRNIQQLESSGLQNIKRTVAQNYFTWVVGLRNDQFRFLALRMKWGDWPKVLSRLPTYEPSTGLSRTRFLELCIFSRMLWIFAERFDKHHLLQKIPEPEFGNPFPVFYQDRLISQDIANSILELYSILEPLPLAFTARITICELGAGYGRNAFVFLKAFPKCRYIIVDIPPALYISQEYLATMFPDRKIMRFRPFKDFSEIKDEFEQADVIFLLPHQAEQLAEKSIDLFINISSLHEMTREQITAYFTLINKLTCGHFYLKQWKKFKNATDGITIAEADYPYRDSWQKIFSRTARAQPNFFEALYKIAGDGVKGG